MRARMRRTPDTTLSEAIEWLHRHLGKGAICPCCGNHCRVWPRVLNSGMARALIAMYRTFGRDYGDLPALLTAYRERWPVGHPLGGEESKLCNWGLLELDPSSDPREARYRVTCAGEDFALGITHVPKYSLVLTIGGRCMGLAGGPWSVRNALGKKFSLEDLLNEPPFPIPPLD